MNAAVLKAIAAELRRAWSAPAGRAWSRADVLMVKLLKTIEALPDPAVCSHARMNVVGVTADGVTRACVDCGARITEPRP